ncbi:unnamed protein product, partial [Prorocentrum cordatum]
PGTPRTPQATRFASTDSPAPQQRRSRRSLTSPTQRRSVQTREPWEAARASSRSAAVATSAGLSAGATGHRCSMAAAAGEGGGRGRRVLPSAVDRRDGRGRNENSASRVPHRRSPRPHLEQK